MGTSQLGLLVLAAAVAGQPAALPDSYYANAAQAAQKLNNQLFFLQRSLATIPGPPEGRGFYKQIDLVSVDLDYLQNQIQRKVSRDSLYLAFDPMNGKLKQFLGDIQNAEQWAPALQMAARQAAAAEHDLYLALAAGDSSAARQAQTTARQIQLLTVRTKDLEGTVNYVFAGQPRLAAWKTDFLDLRAATSQLQLLQSSNASRDAMKKQLLKADAIWDKMVTKVKGYPEYLSFLLKGDFARVDQVIQQLSRTYGIDNRRAPLKGR
jgi:hypothetical protein